MCYISLPNLVQIGSLFNIAAIGTIGQKSTLSIKNFFIFEDILIKLMNLVLLDALYIPTKLS